tara:strand:+ start:23706 stop:24071 length:366 start_codon:yes stop_codon:yes gene_type:complete
MNNDSNVNVNRYFKDSNVKRYFNWRRELKLMDIQIETIEQELEALRESKNIQENLWLTCDHICNRYTFENRDTWTRNSLLDEVTAVLGGCMSESEEFIDSHFTKNATYKWDADDRLARTPV